MGKQMIKKRGKKMVTRNQNWKKENLAMEMMLDRRKRNRDQFVDFTIEDNAHGVLAVDSYTLALLTKVITPCLIWYDQWPILHMLPHLMNIEHISIDQVSFDHWLVMVVHHLTHQK